jgi:hypothetical protein
VFELYYQAPPVVFGRVFAAHSDWSGESPFKAFAVRFEYAAPLLPPLPDCFVELLTVWSVLRKSTTSERYMLVFC